MSSRLARWARDPLSWVVVVSALGTIGIASLLVSTLEPGLDQMVAQAPVDRPVEDLGEKLAEAETAATPVPPPPAPVAPPPARPRAVAPPPAVAAEGEDDGEPQEDWRARRVRRNAEPVERGLRRQIRELEHLREALERERRQIRRHSREQESRFDPDGHHLRQMRLAELDIELARVERDIRRLERGRPTLD